MESNTEKKPETNVQNQFEISIKELRLTSFATAKM